MPVNWMDVSEVPFNAVLLLERVQISWFPGRMPEPELALALGANPAVAWFLRGKCPGLTPWLDTVMAANPTEGTPEQVRAAEVRILKRLNDRLVYVLDPAIYDAQPFLNWDSKELTALTDFSGQVVLDIGAGTGRLALTVAGEARAVYAVEPVANLRRYLKEKARERGLANVYPVDGLITEIPFQEHFADITMGGHVFGDEPEAELGELLRVTKPGGMVILCPGNDDEDNHRHSVLAAAGFQWSRFEEPGDGIKRKYWRGV